MVASSTVVFSPPRPPTVDVSVRINGAPASSNMRSMSENPTGGRRPIPNSTATSNGPAPTPPMPTLRKAASSSNLSATNGLPASQVIALARDSMRNALDSETQVAEGGAVGAGIKPGVTVDLSRRNIHSIPEEVVDIVKNELERLALSHNQISSLPARFSECTSLRYLNIRANQISEFPKELCDLKALEILDLGRNQLEVLPPEIAKLSSLKVLSVRKNQIRELPLCLADMGSLQVLKFEGNPLVFPPREALQSQAPSPPRDMQPRDTEVTEVAITSNIKRYLKQYSVNGRSEIDQHTGDEMSEAGEVPRTTQMKRRVSGRFPVKVNGADLPDTRSPSIGRAPPIPQRAHQRGFSQQNTAARRPGVMPLTLGNANERLRSNSETLLRTERSESRARRMGVVSKKGSDLGTLEETEANNRFSHYRGLSHGSAMQGQPVGTNEPPTPTEQYPPRPVYVRRLSILPERRRESKVHDPVLEAAKGVLYSVFQIHPIIQMLMSLTNDGSAKRSSLEIVFYNTNSHVQELEQEIQRHDIAIAEDEAEMCGNENVHRACQTLVGAYGHVCTLLADNIDTFVDNGDPRYVRTLLMLIYNSIMELRVTMSSATVEQRHRRQSTADSLNGQYTLRPHTKDSPVVQHTMQRAGPTRSRNGTVVNNAAKLQVATNVPMPDPYNNGASTSRSDATASATPRSGESFSSAISRDVPSETSEEDTQFDQIYLSLQRSVDVVLRTLPNFHIQLSGRLRDAMQRGAGNGLVQEWKSLIATCGNTIQQTEVLRSRLSVIKLKEPGVRSQPSFWNLCSNFIASWYMTALKIRSAINNVPLPPDTRMRLKPIQQSIKETSTVIVQSPWQHLCNLSDPGANGPNQHSVQPMSPTQMPITPQSAALGPAMQATVPRTPSSASSFASAFQGNVFDRAEALMANPGISMTRPTMPRKGHSNLSSLSSVSSLSSEGGNIPPGMNPNMSFGAGTPRLNGSRTAF